jgi:aminoglycoside 3-N-acetyltransferase
MQDAGHCLVTRSRIRDAFDDAGIKPGDILCVHTAMSRLGYVCGGARAIIEGIQDVLGSDGTLMMPSYSRDTADPREWRYPPAPADWLDELVAETPPYDPMRTATQSVGAVAELFRTYPCVCRSNHPISSVAAIGPKAALLTSNVPLDNRFGEESPFGRLVRLGGKAAMLGAPYETMSLLHLSQYRIGRGEPVVKSACMMVDGQRQWVQFNDLDLPHKWANDCVADMVKAGLAIQRSIGSSYVLVVDAGDAVDFAVSWRRARGL